MSRPFDLSLYLVTDPALCAERGVVETAAAAAKGGATLVQLRDKNAPRDALIEQARALKAALAPFGLPLIVNDDVEAAVAADADGAHIGQSDGDLRAARNALGPDRILGLTVDTPDQARGVDPELTDYIGAGPVNPTTTKPDHAQPIGVLGAVAYKGFAGVPTVAIGGVGLAEAGALIRAGLDGVAIVSAICAADDPESAARELRREVEKARA